MNPIFSIERIVVKLFIAIILISIFSSLYLLIPNEEFLIEKVQNITVYDKLQYSVYSQVGAIDPVLYPNSFKTKFLRLCQMFLGYSLILI